MNTLCFSAGLVSLLFANASISKPKDSAENSLVEAPVSGESDLATEPPKDVVAYCGVAALEFTCRRLGIDTPSGDNYERLKKLPIASLSDLREAFENNGLKAKFPIVARTSTFWW